MNIHFIKVFIPQGPQKITPIFRVRALLDFRSGWGLTIKSWGPLPHYIFFIFYLKYSQIYSLVQRLRHQRRHLLLYSPLQPPPLLRVEDGHVLRAGVRYREAVGQTHKVRHLLLMECTNVQQNIFQKVCAKIEECH